MSIDQALNGDIHALLAVPADDRAKALEGWLAAQPDADAAARVLARTLVAMGARAHGCSTELNQLLDAERLRFPLDEAAEKCADPALQSELWRCASTSALQVGELADLPYAYARRAVRADPANAAAWAAFQDALGSDNTDFFEDAETWIALARRGKLPADMPRRALAAARVAADQNGWDDRDLAALVKLEGELE